MPQSVRPAVSWPALGTEPVVVGGVAVTCEQARAAVAVLAASRTSAIAPVLRAAGNPLASCDYLAAARPYLAAARALPKTGRAGAAGRHVTKHAFVTAIASAVDGARSARLTAALRHMRADERYAAQIAADAVEVRRREHAAQVRLRAEGDIAASMARCAATGNRCALVSACGTGRCAFAAPWLAPYDAPAAPGRLKRPDGHVTAGQGFSPALAIAAALADQPYRPQITVRDTETCAISEAAA